MASAIYPGSFDPVHNGHLDVTERAAGLFDTIVVGVYDAPPKNLLFSTRERIEMFKEGVKHIPNVDVKSFQGLAVDFARTYQSKFILRGLRAGSDFEVEFEMAHMWRKLAPDIDVICVMSSLEHQFIHSSRIKEVARLGGDVTGLVPRHVASATKTKLNLSGKS